MYSIALRAARRAWQRLRRCPRATAVAVYIYDLFPGTSTGLAGHSRAPNAGMEVCISHSVPKVKIALKIPRCLRDSRMWSLVPKKVLHSTEESIQQRESVCDDVKLAGPRRR